MLLMDAWRFPLLCLRPSLTLAAENLFLRNQLARYQECYIKLHRTTHGTRMALAWLARWFDWRQTLAVVQPATLIRWHRQGFRFLGPGHSAAALILTGSAARPPAPASRVSAGSGPSAPWWFAPRIPVGSEGGITIATRGVAHYNPMP